MTPDLFDVATHLDVLKRCSVPWNGHDLPLATPPGTRYPYVYPRDLAAAVRALDALERRGLQAERAHGLVLAAADFLATVQAPDGTWAQRYALDGTDASIYRQEDNVAHGMIVLATAARSAERRGAKPGRIPRPGGGEIDAIPLLTEALRHARAASLRPGVNLFYSTTTIHESAIEEGYTIWNNFAHRRALQVTVRLLEAAGHPDAEKATGFLAMLDENLKRHFVSQGELLRRVTPIGRADRRPDVTLLAPFYFEAGEVVGGALDQSAVRVERELWDPDLGLVARYLPFTEDPTVHAHGGHGPWVAYSAILAQYHARRGSRARAREILRLIAATATESGALPEHLTTRERFLDFWDREWQTGRDQEKEFDRRILRPGVPFSRLVEELVNMKNEYERLKARADAGEEVLAFAAPLAWAHAEFVEALLLLGSAR